MRGSKMTQDDGRQSLSESMITPEHRALKDRINLEGIGGDLRYWLTILEGMITEDHIALSNRIQREAQRVPGHIIQLEPVEVTGPTRIDDETLVRLGLQAGLIHKHSYPRVVEHPIDGAIRTFAELVLAWANGKVGESLEASAAGIEQSGESVQEGWPFCDGSGEI